MPKARVTAIEKVQRFPQIDQDDIQANGHLLSSEDIVRLSGQYSGSNFGHKKKRNYGQRYSFNRISTDHAIIYYHTRDKGPYSLLYSEKPYLGNPSRQVPGGVFARGSVFLRLVEVIPDANPDLEGWWGVRKPSHAKDHDSLKREYETIKALDLSYFKDVLFYHDKSKDESFLILPLLPGKNLASQSIANIKDKVKIIEDIIGLIKYVHSKGYIHGDIKPANFQYDPLSKKTCLLDFGCTRHIDEIKKSYMHYGTLGYIPPGINVNNESLNFSIDLFALGKMIEVLLNSFDTPAHIMGLRNDFIKKLTNYEYNRDHILTVEDASQLLSEFDNIIIAFDNAPTSTHNKQTAVPS